MKQYKITIIADTHSTEFIINSDYMDQTDNVYQFYNKIENAGGLVETVMLIEASPRHTIVVEYD